jgi:hypothetical protein
LAGDRVGGCRFFEVVPGCCYLLCLMSSPLVAALDSLLVALYARRLVLACQSASYIRFDCASLCSLLLCFIELRSPVAVHKIALPSRCIQPSSVPYPAITNLSRPPSLPR